MLLGEVTCLYKLRNLCKIQVGGLREDATWEASRQEDNIKFTLKEEGVSICTGFIWLMIGTRGWLV
jgi:hypothetical protein